MKNCEYIKSDICAFINSDIPDITIPTSKFKDFIEEYSYYHAYYDFECIFLIKNNDDDENNEKDNDDNNEKTFSLQIDNDDISWTNRKIYYKNKIIYAKHKEDSCYDNILYEILESYDHGRMIFITGNMGLDTTFDCVKKLWNIYNTTSDSIFNIDDIGVAKIYSDKKNSFTNVSMYYIDSD